MILYRVVSGEELKKLICYNKNYYNIPGRYGKNTFNYQIGTEYMHFFKYAEHADIFKHIFGIVIMQVEIPDELIDQHGFGYYNFSHEILEKIVIPECIIKKENFDVKFIKDFQIKPSKEWCYPFENSNYTYKELYEAILLDLHSVYENSRKYYKFSNYLVDILKDKNIEELMLNYINVLDTRKQNQLTKRKTIFNMFNKKK